MADQGDRSNTDLPRDAAYSAAPEIIRRPVRRAKVLVLDDHQLLAQMLVSQLNDQGHEAMSIDVTDARLVDRVAEIRPDLLLLDAVFSDDEGAGLQILQELRARDEETRVVIITGVVDQLRHAEFLDAGALAIISKADSFDQVVAQIADLLAGTDPMGVTHRQELRLLLDHDRRANADRNEVLMALTPSELSTLQGLMAGHSVAEMALTRTVAVSTVRSHVRAILRKLGVHSQLEAVAIGAEAGLASRPST